MKLVCKAYSSLCELQDFEINGIKAYEEDFGEHYDVDEENADPYCCANMKFVAKPATQEVLDKYKISTDEYNKICEKLDEELSFGDCGWCE